MSEYIIKLSMNSSAPVHTGLVFKRGDNGTVLRFLLPEIDISNTTAKVVFRRANNTSVESDIEVVNDAYQYEMAGNELAVPGMVVADVKIYTESNGTKRQSTTSFVFDAIDDTMDGLGNGTGGYSDKLEQLTGELESALAYYEEAFRETGALIAKGTWNSTTQYEPLNLVAYNGSSWISRDTNTNKTPSTGSTHWQLLISGGGGSAITVDATLSLSSENPVQNKVITAALADKADSSDLNGKVDKLTDGTTGHFAAISANGGISDSGKSASDFAAASTLTEHEAAKINTQTGVHGLRFYNGALQYYDGSSWQTIQTGGGGGSSTLSGLSDVNLGSLANGEVLLYDGATGKWKNGEIEVVTELSALTDVDLTSLTDGQVLVYDATAQKWKNGSAAGSNLVKTNTSVAASAWSADSTYADFGYKADITVSGIDSTYFADVVFAPSEAVSGKFAPVSATGTNKVTIYASEVPNGSITIPTIKLVKGVSV